MKVEFKKLVENAVIPTKAEMEIVRTLYEGKRKYYICKCKNCGSEKRVRSDALIHYKCPNCSLRNDAKSMVGEKFGKLTVVEFAGHKNGRVMWRCECECGKTIICNGYNLRSGQRSCGCERKGRVYSIKHGLRHSRLYNIWCDIKKRCYNPNCTGYKNYGGRGIKMCDEWYNSPSSFSKWALDNGYADDLTIERKDYNGNYEPENCTWIPREKQSLNQSRNIVFYNNSERYTLSEIANKHDIEYNILYHQYRKNKNIKSYLAQCGINEQYEQVNS